MAPLMPYILAVGGAIGLLCSFILSRDEMELAKNTHYVPSCNLNPVLSCGSVMHASQSSVFGFPNSWIGLITFTIFLTIGVCMMAGASFKRWFWLALEGGTLLGIGFAYWLLFVSIYRVQALCPFCLTVDVTMTTVFWYLTLYIIRERYLPIPRRFIGIADFCRRYHFEILISWFFLLTIFILHHFWYYYGKIL